MRHKTVKNAQKILTNIIRSFGVVKHVKLSQTYVQNNKYHNTRQNFGCHLSALSSIWNACIWKKSNFNM